MEKVSCDKCEFQNALNAKYCSNCGFELPKNLETQINIDSVNQKKKKEKPFKNKLFTVIITVGSAGLASIAVNMYFNKTPSIDKQLMETASELNKNCPIMVDVETQLDNSVALSGKTFQYNYTLVNLDKSTTDSNELKSFLEPSILQQVKSNPQMKFFRDNKVILNYLYKDKNSQYIAMISIKPEMYQ